MESIRIKDIGGGYSISECHCWLYILIDSTQKRNKYIHKLFFSNFIHGKQYD